MSPWYAKSVGCHPVPAHFQEVGELTRRVAAYTLVFDLLRCLTCYVHYRLNVLVVRRHTILFLLESLARFTNPALAFYDLWCSISAGKLLLRLEASSMSGRPRVL